MRWATLGHFPQSWELSTLGGWVASRSSGQQSLRYGRIEQLFAGGTLETFAGPLEIATFPASAAGPDLRELVLGSEGRFGIISSVKVRVSPLAEDERFYSVFLPNWQQALQATRELAQARVPLSMLRLSNAVETMTQLALAGHPGQIAWLEKYLALRGAGEGKCMLTFGVTGNRRQNGLSLSQAKALLKRFGGVFTGTLLGRKWAQNRFRFPTCARPCGRRATPWTPWRPPPTGATSTACCRRSRPACATAWPPRARGSMCSPTSRMSWRGVEHLYHLRVPSGRELCGDAGALEASQACGQPGDRRQSRHHQPPAWRRQDHAPYLPREKGELGVAALRAMAGHFDPAGRLNRGTLLQD